MHALFHRKVCMHFFYITHHWSWLYIYIFVEMSNFIIRHVALEDGLPWFLGKLGFTMNFNKMDAPLQCQRWTRTTKLISCFVTQNQNPLQAKTATNDQNPMDVHKCHRNLIAEEGENSTLDTCSKSKHVLGPSFPETPVKSISQSTWSTVGRLLNPFHLRVTSLRGRPNRRTRLSSRMYLHQPGKGPLVSSPSLQIPATVA